MKRKNYQILICTIIVIIICIASIALLTLPSIYVGFDLTKQDKSSIGSAIGGITAPVIGVISSILLYLALTTQTESNKDQRLKNESDIIFLLFHDLEAELNNFYYKFIQTNYNKDGTKQITEVKFTGLEGLHEFSHNYRFKDDLSNIDDAFTFEARYPSKQIVYLIETFNLLEERVKLAEVPLELKSLFVNELRTFYDGKLRISMTHLTDTFIAVPRERDHLTQKIETFFLTQERLLNI